MPSSLGVVVLPPSRQEGRRELDGFKPSSFGAVAGVFIELPSRPNKHRGEGASDTSDDESVAATFSIDYSKRKAMTGSIFKARRAGK